MCTYLTSHLGRNKFGSIPVSLPEFANMEITNNKDQATMNEKSYQAKRETPYEDCKLTFRTNKEWRELQDSP